MSPKTAITRFDLSMSYSEFDLLANRLGYIGLRVLPPIGVGKQASDFLRVKVTSVLGPIESTLRAPKGNYSRSDFEWDKDSYATEDHGVEEELDDRTIEMYASEIRSEQIYSARAVNRVLQAFENEVAAAVFNTTTWTGSALTSATSGIWSTKASGKPIDDIDNAIEKVKASCGARPNSLIVSDYALRKLKRTAQVEDLLKYSGRDDPKNLGIIAGLKELFGLEDIIVGDGFKNTAGEGQATPTFSRLWDTTKAMVAHIDKSPDLESPRPTIGRTIMWQPENAAIPGADGELGVIMEEYREENRRGGVIRARNDRVIKILHAEAGHLITGVCA